MRRAVAIMALGTSAVFASDAHAQRLDRTKRPLVGDPAPFAFPEMQARMLSNGLRVVVIENHALPLVSVRAAVAVDSIDDPVGKEGLFVLTAGLLREGTTTRAGDQLSSAAALLGNAVFPFRFTTIPRNVEKSLELMSDMLMHPTFPAPALDRLKATLGAAQQRELQVPATIPNRVFLAQLFGASHPVARTAVATDATMKSITRDDIVHFHSTYFSPNNTTLVVVGDIRAADVSASIEKYFGAWERGAIPNAATPSMAGAPATTIYLLDRPGAQQSYVFVGALGPNRTSPDFSALEVMAPILGASGGSRLVENLRERHSYMYSGTPAALVWRPAPTPSIIGGSAAVAAAKTDSALIAWIGELGGMREREPSPQEMTLARGALIGALPAQIETNDLIANRVMSMAQNGVPLDFYNDYVRRVDAVKPADVRTVAAKYIDLSHLVIVVAGDRSVVEPLLRAVNIAPIVNVGGAGKS